MTVDSRQTTIASLTLLALMGCSVPTLNHREEAQAAASEGRLAEAIERFDAAIRANPDDARAYFGRGSAKLRRVAAREIENLLSTADSAAKDFTEALRLVPTHAEAYYSRAMASCILARYKDAARDLLSSLQLSTEDSALQQKCHRKLAILYDEKFEDKSALARAHLEKYVALGGGDPALVSRLQELRNLASSKPATPDQELRLREAKTLAASGDLAAAADILSGILKSPQVADQSLSEAKMLYAQIRVAQQNEREAATLFELAERLAAAKSEAALEVLDDLVRRFPGTAVARTRAAPLKEALRKGSN